MKTLMDFLRQYAVTCAAVFIGLIVIIANELWGVPGDITTALVLLALIGFCGILADVFGNHILREQDTSKRTDDGD